MKIKIISSIFLRIKLYTILMHIFIIFEITGFLFFYKLPSNVILIKKLNKFLMMALHFSIFTYLSFRLFYQKILFQTKLNTQNFCKKLYFKGLGFKIINMSTNNFVEIKTGFSHTIKIYISKHNDLSLFSDKNMLIIKGAQKYQVGNFASLIRSFRVPDIYKGKGF